LHYTFGPLLAQRTFTVLLVTSMSYSSANDMKEGWVVSVPFDTSTDPECQQLEGMWGKGGRGGVGVRGKYAAVEWIREVGDGKLEWRMATTSSPGGRIPKFLAEAATPKAIARDVKHFLDWKGRNRGDSGPVSTGPNPPVPTVIVQTV